MMGYIVIPVSQEAVIGGSQSNFGPGKDSARPYLKNKLKAKGWGHVSTEFNQQYCKKKKKIGSQVQTINSVITRNNYNL
jgi:hypothetical protein